MLKELLKYEENDYLDFKEEWYKNNIDLLRDILSMSNSLSDKESRYLVIGVSDNKEHIKDISNDENRKTSENLMDFCREYMSVPPDLKVITEEYDDNGIKKNIDIIQITPQKRQLPYVSNKCQQFQDKQILKNIIYTRNGGGNTPWNENADKSIIEELFARKNGTDLDILDRFKLYLDDYTNWKHIEGSENTYYYKKNHKFKIIKYPVHDDDVRRVDDLDDYHSLLIDTCISKDYWDYKLNIGSTYHDYYEPFDVELWADNTLIKREILIHFYARYFFTDNSKNFSSLYMPELWNLKHNLKNQDSDIIKFLHNYLPSKICKILFFSDIPLDINAEYEDSLNYINYDFILDDDYIKKNEDYLFKKIV